MTENEAVEELKENLELPFGSNISDEASRMAMKALEEIQQYHKIGTVEECREAMERQRAKKTGEPYINGYGNKKAECLNCHCTVLHPAKYCKFCGQKLDWRNV